LIIITYHGASAFTIEGTTITVVIDPGVVIPTRADVVYVSHPHIDHIRYLKTLVKRDPNTIVLASPEVRKKIEYWKNTVTVVQGRSPQIKGCSFRFLELPHGFFKTPNLGLILDIEGVSIVHPGDTKTLDPLKNIPIDILMVPVGGIFTTSIFKVDQELKRFKEKPPHIILMHSFLFSKQRALKYLQKRHPTITFYDLTTQKLEVTKEKTSLSVKIINT